MNSEMPIAVDHDPEAEHEAGSICVHTVRGASPPRRSTASEAVARRWARLGVCTATRRALLDRKTADTMTCYERNIENFIGTVKVPVGVAGPLRVHGDVTRGDFHVPLATTEAALVASYNRGAKVLTAAGGCRAAVLDEGVSRSPAYAFHDLAEARGFVAWIEAERSVITRIAESTTRHGTLRALECLVEGNRVYLRIVFATGEASGQNMVTLAAAAVHRHVLANAPVRPRHAFVEANFSGDKKASAQSFLGVRGKRVTAEVHVPASVVEDVLHARPEHIAGFWGMCTHGALLSGTVGSQAHFANALAALYIACGQDAACVAESAVGTTRIEVDETGGLYACVLLPNLMLGTVGGGTGLPSQQACLDVLGFASGGSARALAEVAAGLCLAGELSLVASICTQDFAAAHERLARGRG